MSRAQKKQHGGEHYLEMGVQPWDVIATWPIEQQIGFYRGNVIKYMLRFDAKDNRSLNLKKAHHYLEKLLEVIEPQPDQ